MIFWSWQQRTYKKYPNIPICPNLGASIYKITFILHEVYMYVNGLARKS